jgi:hypothetical protein
LGSFDAPLHPKPELTVEVLSADKLGAFRSGDWGARGNL